MKKRNFLSMALLSLCVGAWAQDPVHGVDGYYNWTPTQLQASNALNVGNNGRRLAGWERSFSYTDDMQYAKLTMGVNNASIEEEKGGFNFRSELTLNESASGAGIMTITRAYPVIAIKISAPVNDEASENVKIGDGYFEPEFRWYNPATGNAEKLQVNGLDGNGRYRFLQYGGPLVDSFGRDSVQLNRGNNGNDTYRTANAVHKEYEDSIWHLVRLPKDVVDETGEKAEFLLAIDLSTICAEAQEGGGVRCLDTTDIKLSGFSLAFLGIYADTLHVELNEAGDTVVARAKTKDELPTVYLKWIKTFPSMKAFDESLTAEQNWGDGEAVDPQKSVLNSALYDAAQFLANYKLSDKLAGLQEAYDKAVEVYNDPASDAAAYTAQIEALDAAKSEFLAAIAYTSESPMNTITSYMGVALGLTTQDVTIGDYTGKLVTPVTAENATQFMFTENGIIAGQRVYNLKTAGGTIVQASDGSLMLVDASQLTGSNTANVIFANRGDEMMPGYDMKVGNYYYYYDEMNGTLAVSEAVPDAEYLDEIAAYLFFPMAAVYDPSDHDAENYPMTSGEGSAWEFNGEVEMTMEPAYEYSLNTFVWNADVRKVAEQRAMLPYVEGWSTNGWRMGTGLVVDKTVEDSEGNPMSCLRLNWMDEYDDLHVDSVSASMVTTNWAEGPQTISIMREHGRYTSALNRVPQPNQQCDSMYAINLNAGINRYFAMKWKGTSPDLTFNGLTFYVRKNVEEPGVGMGNLLEKRGDVYVWDLLECGIPYGDRKACAQYMSWLGATKSTDYVYVDWMRFYDSLEDIPTETIATAIHDVAVAEQAVVTVNGNQVNVYCNGNVEIFTADGRLAASAWADGSASFTLAKGFYVVKATEGNQVAVKKIVLK